MWIKNNFFKYSVGIILVLLIIYLFGKIGFFIAPFRKFVMILFFPILVSVLLYYLLRPLVRLAKSLRLPETLAILAVFLIFIVIFSLIGMYAGSIIGRQFRLLIDDFPKIAQNIRDKALEFASSENFAMLYTEKVKEVLNSYVQKLIPAISGGLVGVVSAITNTASVLVVVPFMLFYLLKDDNIFFRRVVNIIPLRYREEVTGIIEDTDKTLSVYIIGQALIAVILGVLTYAGYLVIGLKYSFILAFFVLITSFIPMFGAIIGVIPAFLVGLASNPFMGVKVLIIMVIVQQVEGNLISPNIIGKRLAIHPLTIILIFLGAASLYGVVGMLIAVPAYAVLKVLAEGGMKIYRIWKSGIVIKESGL